MKVVQQVGSQERRAGEGRLVAQGAVQLHGVAAGFVDLQRQLAAADNQVGGDVGRAGVGGEQFGGLLGNAAGVVEQVHLGDVFPAGATLVASEGLRIRTALDFAVAYGGGLDAAAGFVDGLVDVRPLGVGESALLSNENQVAHAGADLGHGGHFRVGGQQQGQLVVQGHGERVDADGSGIAAPAGYGWAEELGRRQAGAVLPGRGAGDLHRLAGGLVGSDGGQFAGGGEPPRAIVKSADAQADRFVGGHGLHHAVADGDALLAVGHQSDVGVLRAALAGGGEGGCDDWVHSCIDCHYKCVIPFSVSSSRAYMSVDDASPYRLSYCPSR